VNLGSRAGFQRPNDGKVEPGHKVDPELGAARGIGGRSMAGSVAPKPGGEGTLFAIRWLHR
jgi:hypothetical protein